MHRIRYGSPMAVYDATFHCTVNTPSTKQSNQSPSQLLGLSQSPHQVVADLTGWQWEQKFGSEVRKIDWPSAHFETIGLDSGHKERSLDSIHTQGVHFDVAEVEALPSRVR